MSVFVESVEVAKKRGSKGRRFRLTRERERERERKGERMKFGARVSSNREEEDTYTHTTIHISKNNN